MSAVTHPRPAAEYASSYYAAMLNEEADYSTLPGAVTVDIIVIDSGLTGIATVVKLAEHDYKVALVGTHCIGWGASGRNDGQATGSLSGGAVMCRQMRQWLGAEVKGLTWHLRWCGHEITCRRVEKYNITCDLRHGHLHMAMKANHMGKLQASYEGATCRGMGGQVLLLDKAGVQVHLETELYRDALKNTRNMHLYPLNLCIGGAKAAVGHGALIFKHSKILDIVHGLWPTVITREGRIGAQQVLLAGSVYHKLERGQLKGVIPPVMSGIAATRLLGELTQGINPQGLAVYDCCFILDYCRPTADDHLPFGDGANYPGRDSRDITAELWPYIGRTLPRLKGVEIKSQRSCAMGIVMNRIPRLGEFSDNIWYCQGYSGHGVATSHIMGEITAKTMSGSLERFDTFAYCKHPKVPLGDFFGNPMLATGVWYYQLTEKLR